MANDTGSDIKGFDDAPRPAKKRSKVWIGILVALVVIIGGASLIIPQFLDQAKYKDLIKTKVAEATGYSVDWEGDIGISILPLPSVHLNNLTLTNGQTKILALKDADVRVALMPLLSKKVEIASVNLVEPDVTLVIDKQGRSTWMTDKLSKESNGQGDAEEATSAPDDTAGKTPDITLNALKITNGRLLFKNEQAGSEQLVENLNAELSAESLTGPYTAKGDVTYTQKDIEFDIKAAKINGNQQGYPIQARIALPDVNVEGEYSGILSMSEEIKVDGELTVAAKDLEKTIEAFSGKKSDLPEGLGGEGELKAKLVYDGNQALLDQMRISAGDLAYTGSIAVKDLKGNAPPLAINLVPEKGDLKSSSALVSALSDLSVEGLGSFANNKVTIQNSKIGFRGQTISAAGTYAMAAAGKRPVIDFSVKADKLNVDQLTGAQAHSGGAESKTATGVSKDNGSSAAPTGMSLPFDGKLQADIGTLVQGGKTYSPVKADIVSKGEALTINSLTLGVEPNTNINAKGRIGNLSALSDFDLSGSIQTDDAEATMKSLNITKPEALKQKIGPASVNGTFKGSLDQVAFNATVNALRFAVTGRGSVATPMANPVISSLAFNVKHPQLGEALKTFQPGMDAPPSFKGALDLSGNLAWDKTQINVTDLKGSLGNSSIAGGMNIATGGSKPSVKGTLNFGDLVFDATKDGGVAGSNAARPAGTAAPGPRWSSEPIDTAWMNSFDADLEIKARSITQDLWKLTNANLSFALSGGKLAIRDVSAGMFGGEAKLNGEMTSSPLALSMNMVASKVDARQLQSALTSKVSDTVNGTISSFKVDVKSTGASPAALVNALSGKGDLTGNNIVIKGIDAAQLAETAKGSFKPLERAGSLFQTFQNGQTQFDTMDVAMNIQNGVVTFPTLKLDGPRAVIEGKSGNVNLPQWMINLVTTITVKDTDIPPFDLTIKGPLDNPLQAGGNIIEGYLRDKASKKIEKLIGKELEKRFGIPLGGAQETAPAAGTEGAATATPAGEAAPVAAEPAAKQVTPEEEAVKALQQLFKR